MSEPGSNPGNPPAGSPGSPGSAPGTGGGPGTGGSAPVGGQLCLGVNATNYYSGHRPFLNLWKSASHSTVIADGKNYEANKPPSHPLSSWGRYIDQNGDLRNPLPPKTTHFIRYITSPSSAAGDTLKGMRFVLKFDGVAGTITPTHAVDLLRAGNRITWTHGHLTSGFQVAFSNFTDPTNPPRNIRICEAPYEQQLDAGELFNPAWLALVRKGSGLVRFMGWNQSVNDRATLRYLDIPTIDHYSWAEACFTPFVKGGAPLAIQSALANQVQSHPWVCIPGMLGIDKFARVMAATNTNPAALTVPDHVFKIGDKVVGMATAGNIPGWTSTFARKTLTVASVDQAAGTLTIEGVNSSAFAPYVSAHLSLSSIVDLNKITPETTLYAKHFRDKVDPKLATYFELSNETWNFGFEQTHWCAAQAAALGFVNANPGILWGFLAAHHMKVIRDTYGVAMRHRWKGVLATWAASAQATIERLEGVQIYITRHAPTLKIKDLFDVVATTGYWGGGLYSTANKTTIFRWMDESESRWNAGLEPTKYSYFDRMVNQELRYGRHIGITTHIGSRTQQFVSQKVVCDKHGLVLVQYEGGNHSDPGAFSGGLYQNLNADERVRFMEFWRAANHTVLDASNHLEMFLIFEAIGGKYPAKSAEIFAPSQYGAWGPWRYVGDQNPVAGVVMLFNNRP